MTEFSRTTREAFGKPAVTTVDVSAKDHGGQHIDILKNFTDAILDGATLLSPAAEGINSVELANAVLLSAWTHAPVDLPMNSAVYEKALQQRIATSKPKAKPTVEAVADLSKSFNK